MRKLLVDQIRYYDQICKKKGASWELNPGPLACFVFLFIQEVAQSENHTTRPHARIIVALIRKTEIFI